MSLTANVQAFYNLDESSGNAADATSNGRTLTNTGTTGYSAAKINNGAVFDTTNKRLGRTTDNFNFNWSNDYSWSFWFKPTTNAGYLLDHWTTTGANRRLIMAHASAGVYELYCGGFSAGNIIQTTALSTGTWYNFIIVKTGSSWEMFQNNSSRGTATSGSSAYVDNLVSIGAAGDSFGANSNGQFDMLAFWSEAIDSTDRSTLYNAGAGAQWPFGGGGATPTPLLSLMGVGS